MNITKVDARFVAVQAAADTETIIQRVRRMQDQGFISKDQALTIFANMYCQIEGHAIDAAKR